MTQSIVESVIEKIRTLEAGNSGFRVMVNDHSESETWVNFTVSYERYSIIMVGGDPIKNYHTEQATFVVHWVSEHIWKIDVNNGVSTWMVVMEADPLAIFYLAVGFAIMNFDGS